MKSSNTFLRYTPTAQALHWLTVALMLAVLPLAWVFESMPRGTERSLVTILHRSVGLTILIVIALRLIWRSRHATPPEQDSSPGWMKASGRATHWLLYFVFFAMPLSGYLMSGNGKPVSYFGLFNIPGFTKNEAIDHTATALHLAGQWAVYALVTLHITATIWHIAVRRDRLLSRMLPEQREENPNIGASAGEQLSSFRSRQ